MPLMNVNAKTRDNNAMHAKPDLRVFLKWLIYRSGSVITDVIHPIKRVQNETSVMATQILT